MTVVISRQNPDRFTPENRRDAEPPPIYLIAPLSWREKAAWQADLVLAGASRYPPDLAVCDAVKRAVLDLQPDNTTELLAIIEAYRDATGEFDAAGVKVPEEVATAYAAVHDRLLGHPYVALLHSERIMFAMLAPPLCAARALMGWENVPLKFERRGERVPDALIGMIPTDDLAAIGARALELMRPADAEKKASASPSPSADDHKTLALMPVPMKNGHSSVRSTRRTHAN
jgi:hypothetical protein